MLLQADALRFGATPFKTFAAAWDCHVHVFGPRERYPLQAAPRYLPGLAAPDDLRAHIARTGARTLVLVQASPYGTDNSCLLDALRALDGAHRAVISLLPNMISDRYLAQLTALGVRGVRINPGKSAWGPEMVALCSDLTQRLAGTGWHLEINCAPDVGRQLTRACGNGVPLVFDHLAGIDPAHPDFESHLGALAEILRDRNWIKISGLDRVRKSNRDNGRLTQAINLVRQIAPDRIVWGSDWPHTPIDNGNASFRTVDMNAELFWIFDGLGEDAERVISINPNRLYG